VIRKGELRSKCHEGSAGQKKNRSSEQAEQENQKNQRGKTAPSTADTEFSAKGESGVAQEVRRKGP